MGLTKSKPLRGAAEPEPRGPSGDQLSADRLDSVVDAFMEDNRINNPLIPDFVERALYRNVLKLVVGLVQQSLGTVGVDFFGHRIRVSLEPSGSGDVVNAPPSQDPPPRK